MGFEQFAKPKKGRWTAEETILLQECVDNESNPDNPNWAAIEERFNGKRTAKQIRERWSNHINPFIVKRSFTKEEVRTIEAEFAKHKFKWARIASKLENATPLMVKNFWNNRLKRRSKPGNRMPNNINNVNSINNLNNDMNFNSNYNNINNNNSSSGSSSSNYSSSNNSSRAGSTTSYEKPEKPAGFLSLSLPRVSTICSMMSISSIRSTNSNKSTSSNKSSGSNKSKFLRISSLLNSNNKSSS